MFYATVIVCASYFNEADMNNCNSYRDILGPYPTIEMCLSRTDQMKIDLGFSDITPYLFSLLQDPPELVLFAECVNPLEVEV